MKHWGWLVAFLVLAFVLGAVLIIKYGFHTDLVHVTIPVNVNEPITEIND